METWGVIGRIFFECKFKSYYVVWKLCCPGNNTRDLTVFKSYYVVWKPDEQEEEKRKQTEFKSYYVVWKL